MLRIALVDAPFLKISISVTQKPNTVRRNDGNRSSTGRFELQSGLSPKSSFAQRPLRKFGFLSVFNINYAGSMGKRENGKKRKRGRFYFL